MNPPHRVVSPRAGRPRPALRALVALLAFQLTFAGLPVSAALAADAPPTTLIDLSPEDPVAREIAHDVARAIRRRKDATYRSVDETLNVGGEVVAASSLKSGENFLKAGRKAIAAQDFEAALEELEQAAFHFQQAFAFLADPADAADALFLLGVAQLRTGEEASGRKTLRRAVAFAPRRKQDADRFGDAIRKAWEAARTEVTSAEPVNYEVTTQPSNAEVWVNGRYMGLSPTYVAAYPGPQYVRVRKQGFARSGKLVERTAESLGGVDLRLEPARRKPAFDGLTERLTEIFGGAVEPDDLSEAAGLLAASQAVVVRATGTRAKVRVQLALANLSSRQVLRRVDKELSWTRRDKKAIEALVAELFLAAKIPNAPAEQQVQRDSIWGKWWFWTIVGGVVVGSVTAAVVLSGDEADPGTGYAPGTGGVVIRF